MHVFWDVDRQPLQSYCKLVWVVQVSNMWCCGRGHMPTFNIVTLPTGGGVPPQKHWETCPRLLGWGLELPSKFMYEVCSEGPQQTLATHPGLLGVWHPKKWGYKREHACGVLNLLSHTQATTTAVWQGWVPNNVSIPGRHLDHHCKLHNNTPSVYSAHCSYCNTTFQAIKLFRWSTISVTQHHSCKITLCPSTLPENTTSDCAQYQTMNAVVVLNGWPHTHWYAFSVCTMDGSWYSLLIWYRALPIMSKQKTDHSYINGICTSS